jgi:hypothetical protein
LLNRHFSINIGLPVHLAGFFLIETALLVLFGFLRNLSDNRKLLDLAISFQIAGMACSLLGNLVWEKGTLDYIYLKPLFVFDMKDLYLNCFAVLFLVFMYQNKAIARQVTARDLISYYHHILSYGTQRMDQHPDV